MHNAPIYVRRGQVGPTYQPIGKYYIYERWTVDALYPRALFMSFGWSDEELDAGAIKVLVI